MEGSEFSGAFTAVSLALIMGIWYIRNKFGYIFSRFHTLGSILDILMDMNSQSQNKPKSLSGCDRLLLPAILKDFPDFDPELAKIYVKEYLKDNLGSHPDFQIHNVVISQYLPSSAQKTIVYQAAVSWGEEQQILQKRYSLSYCFLLPQDAVTVAANCPNCGAAISYGETTCQYCNSRIANVLKNTWEFKDLKEC